VSECAKNVLKSNVPLCDAQMTKLRRRRQDLRTLSVKKTSLREKRKIIQKGGFLTAGACTDITDRSAVKIMQHTKKLVLLDEFDKEYKRLQRPIEAVAKTDKSLQLSDTLHEWSLADDRKVRRLFTLMIANSYLRARKKERIHRMGEKAS